MKTIKKRIIYTGFEKDKKWKMLSLKDFLSLIKKITEAYGTSFLRSANVCEIESEGISF